jgi:hypothetical protein
MKIGSENEAAVSDETVGKTHKGTFMIGVVVIVVTISATGVVKTRLDVMVPIATRNGTADPGNESNQWRNDVLVPMTGDVRVTLDLIRETGVIENAKQSLPLPKHPLKVLNARERSRADLGPEVWPPLPRIIVTMIVMEK